MHSAPAMDGTLAQKQSLFDKMARTYRARCTNFAGRLSGNRDDAEELTQEAFFRAFRSFHLYDCRLPFDRWMFAIIGNVFRDRLRRTRGVRLCSLDTLFPGDDSEGLTLEIPDGEGDPAKEALRHEVDEGIVAALKSLPAAYRLTILLVDVEQLSYDQAAERLGCAVGTIRSRLHRGRVALRDALKRK